MSLVTYELLQFVCGANPLVPDYVVKGGATYRILTDHLGSPRLVVDTATGAVVQRRDYDAWGTVTLDTNPGFEPFGFTGGLGDRDTDLVRLGAWDYDPGTGRWTARDPIGFNGLGPNLFSYVLGDPVNLVDPHGTVPPAVVAIGGFLLAKLGAIGVAVVGTEAAMETAVQLGGTTLTSFERIANEPGPCIPSSRA